MSTRTLPLSRRSSPTFWPEAIRGCSRIEERASRYIQESVSFLYADGGDEWLDEDAPLDVPVFASAILAAEAQAARFAESGAVGVVLRFGWFYGAGSSHTASQITLARRGLSPFPGAQDGYQALLHLDDASVSLGPSEQPPGPGRRQPFGLTRSRCPGPRL
jgi:nucleoside-diphosphate-sugar epimerase